MLYDYSGSFHKVTAGYYMELQWVNTYNYSGDYINLQWGLHKVTVGLHKVIAGDYIVTVGLHKLTVVIT